MSDVGRYVPLKTVVQYFLDEPGVSKSDGDFDTNWILAFRGMVLMGLQCEWEPLTVCLPVQGNKTVILPPDYISWTKIGILTGAKEISTLKVNKAMTTLKDTNPNRLDYLNPDTNNPGFPDLALNPFFLNFYFGSWYSPLFGIGNGLIQHGECVVDEKNGVIVLSPHYCYPDLMLEYISSPQKNGDYQIETCLQEALIAFLEWKNKVNTELNFYARFREGRRSLPNKRITLQNINQSIRENHGFKLKS